VGLVGAVNGGLVPMAKLYDLARMTTATTGTGTITLGAAVSGFLTFAQAGVQDQDVVSYAIADGLNRETGRGLYTASGTTLTRGPITSTNSNAAISLSGNAQIVIASLSADILPPGIPQGRLTLTTGTPVMIPGGGVSNANTIYYTPYLGPFIPIYNGVKWGLEALTGDLSNLTTDSTNNPAACVTGSLYDLFIWLKAGVLTLTRGPAWTNTTTRSMTLSRVNGLWTNGSSITNGPTTNRGLYVGSFATNASSLIDANFGGSASGGSLCRMMMWNQFNRILGQFASVDNGASYTYGTNSWRQWRASANNALQFLLGSNEEAVIEAIASMHCISGNASGILFGVGIGLDSTTAPFPGAQQYFQTQAAGTFNTNFQISASWSPGQGVHTINGLEIGSTGTASTFTADTNTVLSAMWMY
jgi:hypothetical protein